MLLFKPYHIPLIQNGEKDVSRRMWEKARVKIGSEQLIKTKIFTKENHGRILIKALHQESLLDITEEGARREGGYTREGYLKLFREIYPGAPENPVLWVVGFIYLGKDDGRVE